MIDPKRESVLLGFKAWAAEDRGPMAATKQKSKTAAPDAAENLAALRARKIFSDEP